ncbi:mitochondrial carrier homolog 2 [Thalassophryne amazonica]|uniref:mitochondrial carrier homolog 2 n=1 Tax=Thalassophryne amazonica TaxID=390379 RepID=UPI001472037B|nr:mitochondrial carrier homolog 2 [Thalassophryne amazonica]
MMETWRQVLLNSGLTVLSHPLMYIKVLIQVGHEPLPPTLGRNLFGRQVYHLPGLFAYAKYIIKIDGRMGLLRGLGPRLCAGSLGTVVHTRVLQECQQGGKLEVLDQRHSSQDCSFQHVVDETTKEMMARVCANIVTQPFHVITLRCMVQFIGRETKYSGVFDSIVTIYREEGILGFFAGLIPRLLADVLSLWICNLLAHFINRYAIDDSMSHKDEMRSCSQTLAGLLGNMVTYPFALISSVMAVNNCGLTGGLPPYSPAYPTWVDCWRHLSRTGDLTRGNSLFYRKLPTQKKYAAAQKTFF